jgi:hypothetical protein
MATRTRKSKAISLPLTNGATTFLGEIVSWEFPTGTVVKHAALAAALDAAGLNKAAARALHLRFAFVRAIRKLASDRIIRDLKETSSTVSFQLTRERRDTDHFEYDFENIVTLDLATGKVSCKDASIEAAVTALLATCVEDRKVADLSRLLLSLFSRNADVFPIKFPAGVYFVL